MYKRQIYSVLETVAAGAFTLKYPTSGDYRSAIITEDLDGDNQQEAMAFYQKADEAAIIRVVFMRKAGDAWQSLGDFTNTATQVDKVAFGDVNGDGDQEVIIGWGSAQTGSTSLCVYSIEKGKMKELNLDQSYSCLLYTSCASPSGISQLFPALFSSALERRRMAAYPAASVRIQ